MATTRTLGDLGSIFADEDMQGRKSTENITITRPAPGFCCLAVDN